MRKLIIGVDVDDVTLELVSAWLQRYNVDYNDTLVESDIKSWDIGSYTKIGHRMYDYLKYPSLYDGVEPVHNSLFGVSTLRNMGYRVVFVTASSPEQSGRKYRWLLEKGYVHKRSDYYEALDKSLIATDYLIDDNPDNVVSAFGQGIVFTKPWNRLLINYPRVNNWTEIIDYFAKVKDTVDIIGV